METEEMIKRMPIQEFIDSGLLFFVNLILQPIGICLVVEINKDSNEYSLYPARTKYRGFNDKSQDDGYTKLNKYLKENIYKITNISA